MMHEKITTPAPGADVLHGAQSSAPSVDPAVEACRKLAEVDAAWSKDAAVDREIEQAWHDRWEVAFEALASTQATTIAGVLGKLTVAADTEGTPKGIALLRQAIADLKIVCLVDERVSVSYFLADEMAAQQVAASEIATLARIGENLGRDAQAFCRGAGMELAVRPFMDIGVLLSSIERTAELIQDAAQRFDVEVDAAYDRRRVTAG